MNNQMVNRGFWDNEPDGGDLPPFVDAELKQRIADEGLTFRVVGVREAETAHGSTWMLDIELEGERWTLPFGKTPYRDAQFPRLGECIDRDGPVACGLAAIQGTRGTGWVLTKPPATA
jgi:hypothetical protein